jgi:hypothetical protein
MNRLGVVSQGTMSSARGPQARSTNAVSVPGSGPAPLTRSGKRSKFVRAEGADKLAVLRLKFSFRNGKVLVTLPTQLLLIVRIGADTLFLGAPSTADINYRKDRFDGVILKTPIFVG